MATCIVVPTINSGYGWGNNYVSCNDRPAYIYYKRSSAKTGEKFIFKLYIEYLKDAKIEIEKDGHVYLAYGYEQDYGFEVIK